VNRANIQFGIAYCLIALGVAVIYAVVRLYVLSQRVDWSILVVNVIAFAAISGVLIYLTQKDKDLKEEQSSTEIRSKVISILSID
jgi:membrane protein YdbS with pleckstrin-like domain